MPFMTNRKYLHTVSVLSALIPPCIEPQHLPAPQHKLFSRMLHTCHVLLSSLRPYFLDSPFFNNPLSSNAFVPPAKGTLIGLCSLKLGLVMGTVGSVGVAGSGGGVERGGGGR